MKRTTSCYYLRIKIDILPLIKQKCYFTVDLANTVYYNKKTYDKYSLIKNIKILCDATFVKYKASPESGESFEWDPWQLKNILRQVKASMSFRALKIYLAEGRSRE